MPFDSNNITFKGDPFKLIGSDWALLAAGTADDFNMMTVSWGQVGVLWNKPVATAYVRPQRYTKGYMDACDFFTLSFFDEKYRSVLSLCGSKSGRDIDKMHGVGLTVHQSGEAICFEEAKLTLVCRKLYVGKLDAEGFHDTSVISACYPKNDFHTFYTGEIILKLGEE